MDELTAEPPEARTNPIDRLLARVPHSAFRAIGAGTFVVALAWRLSRRADYSSQLLFWLETAVPAAILAAYLTRPPPVRPARGLVSTVVPLLASVTPFGFLHCSPTAFGRAHEDLLLAILSVPTATMVFGYLSLNRSFAIMAEARPPRLGGAYRFVRHPVYASQMACGLVVLAWRFCAVSLVLYVLFVGMQLARARVEEAALAESFPEYAAYARRTARFIPFVW